MFKDNLFEGQHILVTGGGTGLGKSMAEQLLRLGARVSICGRRLAVCEETAHQLIQDCGGTVTPYAVDIRDADAVEAMIQAIDSDAPLTGLINNAAGNFIARTEDLSPKAFMAISDIVFRGSFFVTQAVGKRWIGHAKARGGWQPGQPMRSVVSIIVTWVLNGGPYVVPSAMGKAGVAAMTRSLALEWARHGIRLNAVGPGEIPTEGMSARLSPGEVPGDRVRRINPQQRVGEMSELNNLVTFLLSPGCDWLSGQLLFMDGAGYMATGGNFFGLRDWTDEQWQLSRERIVQRNDKDREGRLPEESSRKEIEK